jgi:ABC-type amino acid transport substrate-binding protein
MSVAFSTPYIQSKHLLLLNRKATIQYHLSETEYSDELAGKKISLGVKSGSFFATQVRKDFPFAKISFFNTDDELYTSVESGAVSAVLTDEVSIQNWQSEHPRFAFYVKKLYRKNRSGHIAIAVNWGSNPLLQWVNLYLETIRNDGTLEKWIHGFLVEQVWKKSQ